MESESGLSAPAPDDSSRDANAGRVPDPTVGRRRRWVDVLGAAGVILSLIFVGIEIRQNTRAVRAATYQAVTASSMELLFQLGDNPEVGLALDRWAAQEELDPVLVARLEPMVLAYLRHVEHVHFQMTEGTLDEEFLLNWMRQPIFRSPGFRSFWKQRKTSFGREFRDYFSEFHGLDS